MTLYLQIFLLFVAVFTGSLLVDLFRKRANFKLLLSFSGGFLLTIIFTHILPESYHLNGNTIGYFILVGFLLQLTLEYFSKGAEHGHTHVHQDGHSFFPIAIFLSLSVHSFIEVMPVNVHDHAHTGSLYWGVILHKIPEAIALKTIFNASGLSRLKSWIFVGLFSLTAPLGLVSGEFVLNTLHLDPSWILGIAIGMFLHISTTIIFESSEGHKLNIMKLVSILLGFGIGVLMS
ncbi:MAG: ZIP family metal transporter [Bacteroidetes bacterium]|nr:ZIP family metal transporter [Bacteroidota bacterium]